MFISWMLIRPSFKTSLIVEQFQGITLKELSHGILSYFRLKITFKVSRNSFQHL